MKTQPTKYTKDDILFVRKSKSDYKSFCMYGMLNILFHIYGIDGFKEERSLYKILSKLHAAFMHLMTLYLVSRNVLLCFSPTWDAGLAFGSIASSIFPLALHYSLQSKRHLLKNVLRHYRRIGALQKYTFAKGKQIKISFFVAAILLISITSATLNALSMSPKNQVTLSYTFYIQLEENAFAILLRLFTIQMVFVQQYAFPCSVAVLCAVFYYECSELLFLFHKNLIRQRPSFNRSKILSHANTHTSLFILVHKVQDALSSPCFFLLCTQMMTMFCSIAIFVRNSTRDMSAPILCRSVLILSMAPLSVIGVVLCASRINRYCQDIQIVITLVRDKLVCKGSYDAASVSYINLMKQKLFPVISACSALELTLNFVLGMFGSLLSYSLLILSLKNQ
ncbi:hypothetical protein AVEN_187586-1 [Araneus ventricosus]|uniref:Gustatory receptor n=1 Tax=Araneus ventricosus TaxID=182803 RepID=A0A4Y2FWD0_ARAVE|nr:hypothetical protein AVEN_187586-1 [Araneus ventricosus]